MGTESGIGQTLINALILGVSVFGLWSSYEIWRIVRARPIWFLVVAFMFSTATAVVVFIEDLGGEKGWLHDHGRAIISAPRMTFIAIGVYLLLRAIRRFTPE